MQPKQASPIFHHDDVTIAFPNEYFQLEDLKAAAQKHPECSEIRRWVQHFFSLRGLHALSSMERNNGVLTHMH